MLLVVEAMHQPTVIWPGDFPEAALISWAKQLLDPNKEFVDIGAHVGTYALTYAPICTKVHAFEPQRMTYYRLCTGIVMNRLTNVYAHNVALTKPGILSTELKIISTDGGGSSIVNLPSNRTPLDTETVECRTLDSYKLTNVGLIKIDVEGSELDVLRGGVETIRKCRPKLLVEVWVDDWYTAKRDELRAFLKAEKYHAQPIAGFPHMWVADPRP